MIVKSNYCNYWYIYFLALCFSFPGSALAQDQTICPVSISTGSLGSGIAARDSATGTGWILWSQQSVHERFSPAPNTSNADHFLAVTFAEGQWLADNNRTLTPFAPNPTDCLIAEVDFDADSVSMLDSSGVAVNGIDVGIDNPGFLITANAWNGARNPGEFGLSEVTINEDSNTGIQEPTTCPASIPLNSLGSGIAARDNASGAGWILWSQENVHDRFTPRPHGSNADHFLAVTFAEGQWLVDNNRTLAPFTPQATDCLIAEVDFDAGSISILNSSSPAVNAIDAGIDDLGLLITADTWNGARNPGEFGLSEVTVNEDSNTEIQEPTTCPASIPLNSLGSGIAARDNASGAGWILWSQENVHDRFTPRPHGSNADHFLAVTFAEGQWLVDNNRTLEPFTPQATDCLIAEVDFDAGSVNILDSSSSAVNAIDAGIDDLGLSITPDTWNGRRNPGEFGLAETPSQRIAFPTMSNYELIFSDEFNAPAGSSLDPSKWDTALLWGPYFPINNEDQLYVDTLGMHSSFSYSPFEFTGSTLKITATPTSDSLQPPERPPEDSDAWKPRSYSEYRYNGPTDTGPGYQASDVDYLSGIITSYESLKMTYGYVEMRAKLPSGQGLWPAFWLLTTHYVEDVPEIDVMEFLGQDVDTLYHTYHYFDIQDNWRKISTPSYEVNATDWTQDFHTFGMAWSPTEIIYYVDGVETKRITDEDFLITGQAMYLIANVAVGGNWPGAPDETTPFPATFEIDYIRAYKRKLEPELNLAADYQLMFVDNFNGSRLDADKWNTSFLWGPYFPINNEEQYYVDALGSDSPTAANSPFSLSDGILSITARHESDSDSFPIPPQLPGPNDSVWTSFPTYQRNAAYSPGSYTSGIITSYDAFKFVNGYAEMRARIPKGQGLWPAFWLLNGYYVGQQPEIDILEVLGHNPHQTFHTFHRLEQNGEQVANQGFTDNGDPVSGYADGFHKYGVRWQRGKIEWYIDGNVVYTYEGADVPYQLMYVIVNLAVGGNWPGSPDDATEFPASLDIDYIRVYQEKHKEQ